MIKVRSKIFCVVTYSLVFYICIPKIELFCPFLGNTVPPQPSWCILEKNWFINFCSLTQTMIKVRSKTFCVATYSLVFYMCIPKIELFCPFFGNTVPPQQSWCILEKKWFSNFCSLTQTMNKVSTKIFCVTTCCMVFYVYSQNWAFSLFFGQYNTSTAFLVHFRKKLINQLLFTDPNHEQS